MTNSQVLSNYYLEPGSTNQEVILHTSFFHFMGGGFFESNVEVVGNNINFSMCYILGSTAGETNDDQEFIINVPNTGGSNYIVNIKLYLHDQTLNTCDYSNVIDEGTINFETPYNPVATTFVPDDSFEDYFEYIGIGDDIPNNDEVFTHRIENRSHLFIGGGQLPFGFDRIEDLTGIEAFSRLDVLQFADSLISEFDATIHPELTWLHTSRNPISNLDVSNNPELIRLWTGGDNVSELDVTQNINLIDLRIITSAVSELDLSQNSNLTNLEMRDILISELDLSQNVDLSDLQVSETPISTLDLSANQNLKRLALRQNEISSIILNNMLLESIYFSGNLLTTVDLSMCPELKSYQSNNNLITSLDFSQNPALIGLGIVTEDELVSLDLRNGNNENITDLIVISPSGPLTCISVDDENLAPYPGWGTIGVIIYSNDCALGTSDSEQQQAVIYPNPVQNILTIESKDSIESIQIYSMLGELLASEKGVSHIDFSAYTKGIYFLKIDTENGAVFQKVLKE